MLASDVLDNVLDVVLRRLVCMVLGALRAPSGAPISSGVAPTSSAATAAAGEGTPIGYGFNRARGLRWILRDDSPASLLAAAGLDRQERWRRHSSFVQKRKALTIFDRLYLLLQQDRCLPVLVQDGSQIFPVPSFLHTGRHCGLVWLQTDVVHVCLLELIPAQAGHGRVAHLLQPQAEGMLGHAHDVCNPLGGTLEAMEIGSDEQGRTAKAIWSSTNANPVAVHELDQPHGRGLDLPLKSAQVQPPRKAIDEDRGIQDGNLDYATSSGIRVLGICKHESPHETHIDLAQVPDWSLQDIREVNEQMWRTVPPADYVKASRSYEARGAAGIEVHLHCQLVHPTARFLDLGAQLQPLGDVVQLCHPFGHRELKARLACHG
mmetsp:Transcript_32431/g.75356  ORF Transcript_32431/g.75356 Transcript_32431/m.75356 type:complete len:377 (+) Transcript_32431:697-1827(+)